MENKIIASGSVVVENPFALALSGSIALSSVTSSGAIIYCLSGAEIYWAEQKTE